MLVKAPGSDHLTESRCRSQRVRASWELRAGMLARRAWRSVMCDLGTEEDLGSDSPVFISLSCLWLTARPRASYLPTCPSISSPVKIDNSGTHLLELSKQMFETHQASKMNFTNLIFLLCKIRIIIVF